MPKLNTTTSGIITATLTADSTATLELQQNGVAIRTLGESQLVPATVQSTATGATLYDFSGIPSWARRITVMFQGVSTNGTSNYVVRIGNSTFTITGYVSAMTYVNTTPSNSTVGTSDTTGYILTRDTGATVSFTGEMRICLLSNYTYVATFNGIGGTGGPTYQGSGFLNLGSVLDRVRITTLGGTDTFDAGSVNIMWE
jgi:hypothetical protein